MPKFGKTSSKRLESCDPMLQLVLRKAINIIDFSILEGHRSTEKQQEYFKSGLSKLDGVTQKSKHQAMPSKAVDIAPYPIDFTDKEKVRARFYHLQGVIKAVAYDLGVSLRFGLDWDSDGEFTDQSFDDLPHVELANN